jgi:hypothetical protein
MSAMTSRSSTSVTTALRAKLGRRRRPDRVQADVSVNPRSATYRRYAPAARAGSFASLRASFVSL